MDQLTLNRNYSGTVVSLEEAADSFVKRNGQGGKSFCHYMKVIIQGFEEVGPVEAQICTDRPTLDVFGPNDDIKFEFTSLSKGRYTMNFRQLFKTSDQKEKEKKRAIWKDPVPKEEQQPIDPPQGERKFPAIVSGTIVDRALYNSVIHHQYRTATIEDVIAGAKAFMKLYEEVLP